MYCAMIETESVSFKLVYLGRQVLLTCCSTAVCRLFVSDGQPEHADSDDALMRFGGGGKKAEWLRRTVATSLSLCFTFAVIALAGLPVTPHPHIAFVKL
ncbi:MAG: hypothetical protein ACI9P3_005619 [Bradyrhizobium sp.]|jgi:hypothetical protein